MTAAEPPPISTDLAPADPAFDLAALSDVGTTRSHNEDACGHLIESDGTAVVVVADGVGGYEGGEVASSMAVEITLEAWRDSPAAWGAGKRLHRAVQRAGLVPKSARRAAHPAGSSDGEKGL